MRTIKEGWNILEGFIAFYIVLGMIVAPLYLIDRACAARETPAQTTRPDNILTSDNGRFERREWIDDDGWHFTVTDKVKGTVLVLEATEQRGALMGVGDESLIREHGLRVSMGTKGGFREWEQDVRVDP